MPNKIRRQLGVSNYGQRVVYAQVLIKSENKSYMAFSQATLRQLQNQKTPKEKYILIEDFNKKKMKISYKKIIIQTLFLIAVISVNSQTSDQCKYLIVLTYIRTNTDINDKIKVFFPRTVRKKDKYVEFNLSDRVDFIGISHFKERIQADTIRYGITQELLNDNKAYIKKYFFESFRSDFLKKIAERNSSRLFLTFSKPVDNYLVAELGDFNPEINQKVKYGKGMLMFFKFDTSGIIEEVLYSGSAYN